MNLNADSVHALDKLITTAMVAGLKKLIIEPGKIRGIDEKQSVALISTDSVPDLAGKQAGINRIDALSARINLVKNEGDLLVEATEAANKLDISLLELSVGKAKARTKAQFRCASTEAVKGVPKSINDKLVWAVNVDAKLLPTLNQAVSAMGADALTLASRDGQTVSFECVDANKDIFTTDADEAPRWVGQGAPGTSFCWKFPAKTLLALIKEAVKSTDPVPLTLGEQGILSLKVNGLSFFVIPTT